MLSYNKNDYKIVVDHSFAGLVLPVLLSLPWVFIPFYALIVISVGMMGSVFLIVGLEKGTSMNVCMSIRPSCYKSSEWGLVEGVRNGRAGNNWESFHYFIG
jgi:hypothetical protein